MVSSARVTSEIDHDLRLIERNPEYAWGWATFAGRVRSQRRAQIICEGARLRPGMRVLEVGCGTGLFTERFAATGASVVAIDVSGALLEKARARKLSGVEFLEVPLEGAGHLGPFDAVIGSSVLHHLDLEPALAMLFRLLVPGGVASFAEPNILNPQVWVERRFR